MARPPGVREDGKPRRRRRRRFRLGRVLALCAIVLLALLYYRPVHAWFETRDAVDARRAEVRALEAKHAALEKRLANTQSGTDLVRAARRLGLVKPGERLFIVRGIPQWQRAHAHAK
jgi:cell division protein FtsB